MKLTHLAHIENELTRIHGSDYKPYAVADEQPEPAIGVASNSGTVALSDDGKGNMLISVNLEKPAPIKVFWRNVSAGGEFKPHSQSLDHSSSKTHEVVINKASGLHIEAYAIDGVAGSYKTDTASSVGVSASEPAKVAPVNSKSFFTGQGFGSWALANGEIGGKTLRRVSAMRTATKSGRIDNIIQYFIFTKTQKSGYHGGTGGVIRLTVVTDNNGLPSNNVVAVGQITPDLLGPNRINNEDPVRMSSIHPVVRGQKYHFVYENIDPDPVNNWLCVDGMWGQNGYKNHWAVSSKDGPYTYSDNGGPWKASQHQHIYQINYAGGAYEGFGIYGGFGKDPQFDISGEQQVRQVLKFNADNDIQNCWLRVGRKSGNDPLNVTITDKSGNILASDSVSASKIPRQISITPKEHDWVEFAIKGFTALKGETYYATITTAKTSVYHAHPMQIGKGYGFGVGAFGWGGEIAQQSTDGGKNWAGWTYGKRSDNTLRTNRQDAEMSICFNKGF